LAEDATLIMMCQSQKLMEIGRDKSVTVAWEPVVYLYTLLVLK
jgi:hypothetical protein